MSARIALVVFVFLAGGCASIAEKRPPAPTLPEIVQWSKEGTPAATIILRIDAAGAVYPLPASELAKLREQGVPDAVIDHMQSTYIQAERERYLLLYGWPPYRSYPFGPVYPYPFPFLGPPYRP